jgi:hypothetical protein
MMLINLHYCIILIIIKRIVTIKKEAKFKHFQNILKKHILPKIYKNNIDIYKNNIDIYKNNIDIYKNNIDIYKNNIDIY